MGASSCCQRCLAGAHALSSQLCPIPSSRDARSEHAKVAGTAPGIPWAPAWLLIPVFSCRCPGSRGKFRCFQQSTHWEPREDFECLKPDCSAGIPPGFPGLCHLGKILSFQPPSMGADDKCAFKVPSNPPTVGFYGTVGVRLFALD